MIEVNTSASASTPVHLEGPHILDYVTPVQFDYFCEEVANAVREADIKSYTTFSRNEEIKKIVENELLDAVEEKIEDDM